MEQKSACCNTCGVSSRQESLWRGHCAACYKDWVETRPVGMGAQCGLCTERRRENLRLMELFGRSQVLCYNCAAKALKIQPMPRTLVAMRERLDRDRRMAERRQEETQELVVDRRFTDRRLAGTYEDVPWLEEEDLVVDMELAQAEASGHGEEHEDEPTEEPTLIRMDHAAAP